MIGKIVSNYKVTKLIGEGGMASVYEAVHTTLTNRKVAIKILKKELANDESVRDRFIKEANILSSINHSCIVNIYDFIEVDDSFGIIMELLEGETLDVYIQDHGALSYEVAYDIFSKILTAFDYAHSKGIVHRDIKPSNIYIEENKNIKILDFGIAKLLSANLSHTATGSQLGTPLYMSPEQVQDSKHIDHKTDIYSLGVVLHYMLTGKKVYDVNTLSRFQIMTKIVNDPLPPIDAHPRLSKIIQKATQKLPENRYKSCAEFLDDLSNQLFESTVITTAQDDKKEQKIKEPEKQIIDNEKTVIEQATDDKTLISSFNEISETKSVVEEDGENEINTKKEKKGSLKWILSGAGVIAAAVIAFFIIHNINQKKESYRYSISIADSLYKVAAYDDALGYYVYALDFSKDDEYANERIDMIDGLQNALDWYYNANYAEAYEEFEQLLKYDCAEAYYYLGELLYNGYGVKTNDSLGKIYTQKAIENGYEAAYWRLGNNIMNELGYDTYEKYLKAMENPPVDDTTSTLMDSLKMIKQYYEQSLPYIITLADNDDLESIANVGMYYSGGIVYEQNSDSALVWYLKAAEKDFVFAQTMAANEYYNDKQYDSAFYWYEKAADKNDNLGLYGLGTMYYNGKGTKKDYSKALELFERAAENDYPAAYYETGYMYYTGTGVAKDYSIALSYFKKAAETDYDVANYYIGEMYRYGRGVPTSSTNAITYYKKAGAAGYSQGYVDVAEIYADVYSQQENAFKYYKKAAVMGHADAQNSVGYRMYNGDGCRKDKSGSKYWFRLAMNQGHEIARENYYYVVSQGY